MEKFLSVFMFMFTALYMVNGQENNLVEYKFRVEGECGMCKDRIEEIATTKGEATEAVWNVQTKILRVLLDEEKTTVMGVKWELAQAGHDSRGFKAPDEAYNNLHGCCKYRGETTEAEDYPKNVFKNVDEVTQADQASKGFIEGYVYGKEKGKKQPLIGATISIADAGNGTTTDSEGYFRLDNSKTASQEILITYVGFEPHKVFVDQDGIVEIVLRDGLQLETVEVTYKARTTEVSFIKPLNVETVSREELCKAACCNLSESFETNPSVDVSFNDAITGTRQIQMLGLSGPNVQITRELIPDVRVMSSVYGLSMTPGPWIESIQLIKGVGSVVNGFESITGQINVELKKPEGGDKIFLNGYVNNGGRLEVNANGRVDVSEKISTGILVHGKSMSEAHDNNGDGFTDMPFERDFVIANRWKFKQNKNFQGQLGFKVSDLSHEGGYHDHFSGESVDHENHWQMYSDTRRYEAWGKLGYINPDKPQNSIGLQMSFVNQEQDQVFGFSGYDADQTSIYSNLVYQYLKNEHTLRAGLSYQLDQVDEFIDKAGYFGRDESIPGAYAEYTYSKDNKWSVIPGIRVDHHNNYGTMFTPRLHAKYNFSDYSIVRIVGGKGWRTASVFSENIGLFSSSRVIKLDAQDTDNPYGLNPEVAWNYGINYTQSINPGDKEWVISLDFYRTDFENQIVVDFETPTEVSIYNLDGKSYSNSFQIKIEHELFKNFNVRTAYRLFDVKTDFRPGLRSKPLLARHRAFINGAYKTNSDWHFDFTLNWNGSKRLPFTGSNPEPYQRADNSPDFFLLNAQIMKRWGKKWDLYLGAENLFDYKQDNAIVASDDPFGEYFDGSMIWAPLFGVNVYLGFRYTIGE